MNSHYITRGLYPNNVSRHNSALKQFSKCNLYQTIEGKLEVGRTRSILGTGHDVDDPIALLLILDEGRGATGFRPFDDRHLRDQNFYGFHDHRVQSLLGDDEEEKDASVLVRPFTKKDALHGQTMKSLAEGSFQVLR